MVHPSAFQQVRRLCYTAIMDQQAWIQAVRARGWGDAVSIALDVLEPLGPLGAQILLIAQPAARLIGGWGDTVGMFAQALETPGGIEQLRQALDEPAFDERAFDERAIDNTDEA